MIPYIQRGQTTCTNCEKPFEYDTVAAKRKPRVCPKCKEGLLRLREDAKRFQRKGQGRSMSSDTMAVMSYADIGARLGISDERVRQIERIALAKLRALCIQLQIDSASEVFEHDAPSGTRTAKYL